MRQDHPSNFKKIFPIQSSNQDQDQNSKIQITNQLTFATTKNNKQKKINKKPATIIQRLMKTIPQSFNHVYNLLNIIGINERTLKDISYEQSFFKSMFYIKNVEKVELRKNSIIIFTKNIDQDLVPMQDEYYLSQYLIQRYRSFGDSNFYELANFIEKSYQLYINTNLNPKLIKYDGEPLSRFIESMQERIYMCKVAPNRIVISRKLLQLLGEDYELYALKISKYKMPIREIISGQSYLKVIMKSIQTIGLISQFLKNEITFQDLQSKAYMEFKDYLYTNDQKKIFCKFCFYLPTPLINCIELIEEISSSNDYEFSSKKVDPQQRKQFNFWCDQQRYSQTETLRHLMPIPKSLLIDNSKNLAGYCEKQELIEGTGTEIILEEEKD